jgi:hypothetical protein
MQYVNHYGKVLARTQKSYVEKSKTKMQAELDPSYEVSPSHCMQLKELVDELKHIIFQYS